MPAERQLHAHCGQLADSNEGCQEPLPEEGEQCGRRNLRRSERRTTAGDEACEPWVLSDKKPCLYLGYAIDGEYAEPQGTCAMSIHRMVSPLVISKIRDLLLPSFAAVVAGCAAAPVSESQFLVTPENKTEVRSKAQALRLQLPNGNSLRFTASRDERGEPKIHGLVENRRAGNRGIASVPGLASASLPEIYYALAEPEAEIPEPLRLDRYPDPSRPQGWARDIILTGEPAGGGGNICSDPMTWNAFRQEVIDQGYPLVFLSQANGALSTNNWFNIETDWMSPDGHELRGSVDGATALYVSVLRCEGSTTPFYNWGPPRLSVSRRTNGDESFTVEFEEWLPEAGVQKTYISTPGSFGSEHDFRVWLRHYEGSTRFHIGAAWIKPTGTFGPNP